MSTTVAERTGTDQHEDRAIEVAVIRSARHLAAARGLDGFTVEDLCADAGVAREDFARRFATLEDAVIGLAVERAIIPSTVRFLSGGDGLSNDLAPDLLIELTDMAIERWNTVDLDEASVPDLAVALQREPRLMQRLARQAMEREQFDVRMIVQREDLDSEDPRAEAAALLMGRLVQRSALEVLRDGSQEPFADVLRGRVAAAHAFFATQDPPTA